MSTMDVDNTSSQGYISNVDSSNVTYNSHFKANFVIESELGKGGFATVFKAKHKIEENAYYAVKKQKLKSWKSTKRAKDEVNSLKVCKHKNIIKYTTAWIEENCSKDQQTYHKSESKSY